MNRETCSASFLVYFDWFGSLKKVIKRSSWTTSPSASSFPFTNAGRSVRAWSGAIGGFGSRCPRCGRSGDEPCASFIPTRVVRWQRERFVLTQLSNRSEQGGPPLSSHIRTLIRTLAEANPLWCASRIHGELKKLGIEVSERTVSRILQTVKRPPSQTWKTFLQNHVGELVAIDVLHELCAEIFEEQLAGRYTDTSTSPRNRSFDIFATGLITNTIPCWLIFAKNRSPSSENVMCLPSRRSRDLVLANHSPL
jgi:hypothetical protein